MDAALSCVLGMDDDVLPGMIDDDTVDDDDGAFSKNFCSTITSI